MTAAVPRITTIVTADVLLEMVARLALEEPKRIMMGLWLTTANASCRDLLRPRVEWPACGTIGCVAGWVTTLCGSAQHPEVFAGRALHLSDVQQRALFTPRRLCGEANQGSPSHARAVARHIRAFVAANRAQLRATRVAPQGYGHPLNWHRMVVPPRIPGAPCPRF